MIKGIRKHYYLSRDFMNLDLLNFYKGWTDPFPYYLYIKTFGAVDSWPSYARMRLMADNSSDPCIPTALKVLKSDKANNSIKHYAVVLAGLDESNDEIILKHKERCPRALLRVWYNRRSSNFYPMVKANAERLLAGGDDDILDDPEDIYSCRHHDYEDYTIAQRGCVTLEMLTIEQVRELWAIYKQFIPSIPNEPTTDNGKTEDDFRLANAFRAYLMALIYNPTEAVGEIIWEIYSKHNHLLYTKWSQESLHIKNDIVWAHYLLNYVKSRPDMLDNFWMWLQEYAKGYVSGYLYGSQRFFISIYTLIAYHVLPSDIFYEVGYRLIYENYVFIDNMWPTITRKHPLTPDDPPLDHRWDNLFRNYNYFAWRDKAPQYYELVKSHIEPHPEGWTIDDWKYDLESMRRKKMKNIIIPE